MSDIFARLMAELDLAFRAPRADLPEEGPDESMFDDDDAEPCPQCHATGAHANGCELGELPE